MEGKAKTGISPTRAEDFAQWFQSIVRENRSYVTVALGCTGGRHRSVFLAEELAKRFRGDWRVLVRHRKLAQESNS